MKEILSKKDSFKIMATNAIIKNKKYFGLMVDCGLPECEIIINSISNLINGKMEYYDSAYDDEMRLKNNPSIQIVAGYAGDNFKDIEEGFKHIKRA